MRTMKSLVCAPLILCLGFAAPPALADDDCDAPVQQWQSRDAVLQMAAQQGWQVRRLKIDDGCYEIRGSDAQGQAFKARIDPTTLKVVRMRVRDGDHERERIRGRSAQGLDAGDPSPSGPAGAERGQAD